MMLKIWQCSNHDHKKQLSDIGVTSNMSDKLRYNTEENDCPYCIIENQQNTIKQLESRLKNALMDS